MQFEFKIESRKIVEICKCKTLAAQFDSNTTLNLRLCHSFDWVSLLYDSYSLSTLLYNKFITHIILYEWNSIVSIIHNANKFENIVKTVIHLPGSLSLSI